MEESFLDSKFFNPEYLGERGLGFLYDIFYFIFVSDVFRYILSAFALFFISVIMYCSVRLLEIRKKEHKHLLHEVEEYAHHMAEKEKRKKEGEGVSKNEHWNDVLTHLLSSNSADWKLALLEADMMLENLLDQLGFPGQGVGERLRNADRDKFTSLTIAWEVHTIRNKIAHEGVAFELSLHEAKRVIALYESIFRQFGFI